MHHTKDNLSPIISIVGSGIAGITTALFLGKKGYTINLIDPNLKKEINQLKPLNASQASLGIIMGNIYKRSKGRSWELRKRSMELWPKLLLEIQRSKNDIYFKSPLIKLASTTKEYESIIKLNNKGRPGIEMLKPEEIEHWNSTFQIKHHGGVISYEDGYFNTIKLMTEMKNLLKKLIILFYSGYVSLIFFLMCGYKTLAAVLPSISTVILKGLCCVC